MEEKILRCIKEAFDNVTQDYFILETTYATIKRERIFCYELYHQMRCNWSSNLPIKIHGEIDKRGHSVFNGENPDFIFHIPGQFENNRVIVEVKGNLTREGVRKDLKTLVSFVKNYGYRCGVYLIFNYSLNQIKREILNIQDLELSEEVLENIVIMCKENENSPIEEEQLSRIMES